VLAEALKEVDERIQWEQSRRCWNGRGEKGNRKGSGRSDCIGAPAERRGGEVSHGAHGGDIAGAAGLANATQVQTRANVVDVVSRSRQMKLAVSAGACNGRRGGNG